MKKKIGIISGRFPKTSFQSAINHYVYSSINDYTYIHCEWPTGQKNPYLNKIIYIQEYLHLFDYVFWIDDDAFFMNLDQKLEDFIPMDDKIISICKSPDFKDIKTYFSSGQFLIKNCIESFDFLTAILDSNLDKVKSWWSESLGFYTGGDQDLMVYLVHEDKRFQDKIMMWDYRKFNSRFENFSTHRDHDVFILHFTGKKKVKKNNYKKIKKYLKYNQNLLPYSIYNNYYVHENYFKKIIRKIL